MPQKHTETTRGGELNLRTSTMRWRGGRFFSYLIRRSLYLSHGVRDTEAERCGVEGCENLVNK